MKVLVVGGGGREHALCWKISQSPLVEKTYCAPGNAGISRHAECLDIGVGDFDSLVQFVKEESVDLTVVGPEQPLCEGITDFFEEEGLLIFGPSKVAAELEGSKIFSKDLMKKYGIPTGEYFVFTDIEQAFAKVAETEPPFVVKADGLAAGKGVIICHSREEGEDAVRSMMEHEAFGQAGTKVVIEEFLTGEEASFFAFTDGENILPLEPSQDHKPIFDGDKGPNTGGMGAYTPAPVVTDKLRQKIIDEVMVPTVRAMKSEGRTYRGILYAGLMIKDNDLKVLEFNCRFGDPEAQPLLMRMESDLVPILYSIAKGEVKCDPIEWKDGFCVCVVMASRGYPGSYDKGVELKRLGDFTDTSETVVFHAGTAFSGDKLVTNGGRVLGVTSLGDTIEESIRSAYKAVDSISEENLVYRTDIGKKALVRVGDNK
ncbi:MAG: phosphoribosylamine--glycine ligase [Candidatus Dadabacteria bacterium]|nr:phosphoribosylamine--glycine ligase [Candidatus Dadabacteria bacterium]MYC40256.1 phosphoribosylamine--glycine ligase [Candidatus Dadabacteria bacterium]MYH39462.1 phosphoribosylamine--glycine ligase [Candidatus Dadabacteria bacterium]